MIAAGLGFPNHFDLSESYHKDKQRNSAIFKFIFS
jgi:hypothetical protein